MPPNAPHAPTLLDRALARVGLARRPARAAHSRLAYVGARRDRLSSDWLAGRSSPRSEARDELPALRDRTRDLARNNPTIRRWLKLAERNVIGPYGIRLHVQAKNAAGELDATFNDAVSKEWMAFAASKLASADKRLTLHAVARLALRARRTDGEAFIRIIRGARNRWGIAVQVLDASLVDEQCNRPRRTIYRDGGLVVENEIRNGVEVDEQLAAVAYWVWSALPQDDAVRELRRIPADDVVHHFRPTQAGQVRGVPEAHAVIMALKMLDGYEEAELVAARLGASHMGFFAPPADDPGGDPNEDTRAAIPQEVAPGTFGELPRGWTLQNFSPDHPSTAFPAFTKSVQRRISTGLDTSYSTLFDDLEAVNFSSGRIGLSGDRDEYSLEQAEIVADLYDRLFREWVKTSRLTRVLPTVGPDAEAIDVRWQPRRWPSLDPEKDGRAAAIDLALGRTTYRALAAENGTDFDENLKAIAAELQAAKDAGVPLALPALPAGLAAPAAFAGDVPNAGNAPPAPVKHDA